MTYFYCWVKSGHNWEAGDLKWVCSSGPLSTPGHWLRYSRDSALAVFVFKSRVNVTSPGPLPSPCLPQILSTSLDPQTSAIVRAGRGGMRRKLTNNIFLQLLCNLSRLAGLDMGTSGQSILTPLLSNSYSLRLFELCYLYPSFPQCRFFWISDFH